MKMRKRDIMLDFTSLLDVTLIVIFFFVIFSHLDGEQDKARIEEEIQNLEEQKQEAEFAKDEAEELKQQLEEEIELVQESGDRYANNILEMLEFNNSDNLKIILDIKDDSWEIRLSHADDSIAYIENSDNLTDDILKVMEDAGYDAESTIFCDFIYDGSIGGTNKACKKINACLDEISDVYTFFYVSETDLSVGVD